MVSVRQQSIFRRQSPRPEDLRGTYFLGIRQTAEYLQAAESTARRSLQVSSTLDWQAATAARFFRDLSDRFEGTDADSIRVDYQDIEALRGAMRPVTKSVSQVFRESITNLANTALRRRDSYVKSLRHTK